MWKKREIALAALSLSPSLLPLAASTASLQTPYLARRQYITQSEAQASYDYVIAGGGLAGLVLASRLSEDPKVTVLVLEAGKSGDEVKDRIDTPAGAYYGSIVGTEYDWNFTTVPQPNLANRRVSQPRGRILGGSTAMNAMYLVRPSKTEVDAWSTLLAGDGGDPKTASRWGWDNLYKYMKKAENFTPPIQAVLNVTNIKYDASLLGSGGPMQISYPAVMINIAQNWTSSCGAAGVPELPNPHGGVNLGSYITPSSINPTNWTRSYSRPAYIDSLPPRSNLHILPSSTVLRLQFSDTPDKATGGLVVSGVEYGDSEKGSAGGSKVVAVKKEAVLAAGALASPKILMMSGVGPKDMLDKAGVSVKVDLPGVGQRLQDHMTAGVVWQTPLETAGNIHESNSDFSKTKEFNSFVPDAVAFANATALFNNNATDLAAFAQALTDTLSNSTFIDSVVPSSSSEVKAGYKKIYGLMVDSFFKGGIAQMEMLMSLISPGVVVVQAAMQHPYSVGRVYVNSTDPWAGILIDPGFHSHWADKVMMRLGLRLVRRVGAAYGPTLGAEITPGPNLQSDDAIDGWLVNDPGGANSQFHPTGTLAMLPKALGGVVDADTKVYGVVNVRVVDGSVFPFEFAAHLASAGYGVAEQASDLIKAKTYAVKASSGGSTVTRVSAAGMIVLASMVGAAWAL